ncbi:MAG: YqcC family protein [bacterium]|nr:YqcC family protein [bacterium]
MNVSFVNKSEKSKGLILKIEEIESEMKNIGFWSINPPHFNVKTCSEAPSFELWLQSAFLPNTKSMCKSGILPLHSQIGLLAKCQQNYQNYNTKTQNLLKLLNELDDIVNNI